MIVSLLITLYIDTFTLDNVSYSNNEMITHLFHFGQIGEGFKFSMAFSVVYKLIYVP